MSRSYKHNPFIKLCGDSDKEDKVIANRKFRKVSKARTRLLVNENIEDTEEDPDPDMRLLDPPTNIREVSNTWDFSSDGLAYYLHKDADGFRSELTDEEFNKYMRK